MSCPIARETTGGSCLIGRGFICDSHIIRRPFVLKVVRLVVLDHSQPHTVEIVVDVSSVDVVAYLKVLPDRKGRHFLVRRQDQRVHLTNEIWCKPTCEAFRVDPSLHREARAVRGPGRHQYETRCSPRAFDIRF